MKYLLILSALALLTACGDKDSRKGAATYTCPNGPDLAVYYVDGIARLYLPGGRIEELQPTDRENVFARPGIVWDAVGFRTGRLTDGEMSYQCDQMAG